MNGVRLDTDIELGLRDTKPGGGRVSNKTDEKVRVAGAAGAMSPQEPPSNGELLNSVGKMGDNVGVEGNAESRKNPVRFPPLAEPEATDELSEPPTPLPARLPQLPHPLAFPETGNVTDWMDSTNSGDHNHDHDHDHGDDVDGLLKAERGEGGYDELDMRDVNGDIHDPYHMAARAGSPAPTFIGTMPDVNTYQQKKNLAQGMMDLALLSANANQLRYVLESSASHPYYYPSIVLISLSIVFQVLVGIGLILNSRYDIKDESDICKADKINNMTVLGIFLVTLVNVFITSFSVGAPTPGATTVTRTP